MIDTTGEPYIADFGIAKNLDANTITVEDNSVMGSVHYFSPEQARGERADKRSDLYSLGIMMYEMLTGQVPFDGDTSVAIALKHINEEMPDLKEEVYDLPESLNRIILKATQKDKHFRYKSAFAMYEDMQRCLSETDGEYIKYTESKRALHYVDENHMRRSRKNVNKFFLVIGIGVAIVAGLIFTIVFAIGRSVVKETAVPAVIGMEEVKAAEILDVGNFVPEMVYYTSEQPKGIVIGQDPEQGAMLEEGSIVRLFVSKGLETGVMPNVTDMSLEQAVEQLRINGLEADEIERSTEGEASIGYVMEQNPAAGEPIGEDDTVRLKVKISPMKTRPGFRL
jgi:serine/threonine-protein kinase